MMEFLSHTVPSLLVLFFVRCTVRSGQTESEDMFVTTEHFESDKIFGSVGAQRGINGFARNLKKIHSARFLGRPTTNITS